MKRLCYTSAIQPFVAHEQTEEEGEEEEEGESVLRGSQAESDLVGTQDGK